MKKFEDEILIEGLSERTYSDDFNINPFLEDLIDISKGAYQVPALSSTTPKLSKPKRSKAKRNQVKKSRKANRR